MSKINRIGFWELRISIKKVRDRVAAGETFLCLYRKKVKATLTKVEPNADLRTYPRSNRVTCDVFRLNLTEYWRAIEQNPRHPGFVIYLYNKPWGLFKRFDGRSVE